LLFAGTTNFERLRHELQIKERLLSLPPITAALEIRQDLEHRHIPDLFSGIVIASVNAPHQPAPFRKTEELKKEEEEEEEPIDSIERLHQGELETDAILVPTTHPLEEFTHPKFFDAWKPRLQDFGQKISSSFKGAIKRRPMSHKDPLTLSSLRGMNAGHGASLDAQAKKKWIAIGVVVLIIVVAGVWFFRARAFAKEQTVWNTIYTQAVEKKNQAEGDLTYGNEDGARRFLKDAIALVSGLDEKTKERKTTKTQFLKDAADVQNKLKRETHIDNPTELFSLSPEQPAGSLATIAQLNGALFTLDTAGRALVQIDPTTKQMTRMPLPESTAKPKTLVALKTSLLVLMDDRTAFVAKPDAQTVKAVAFGASKVSSTQAATIYNGRLYVLDPETKMIWRYTSTDGTQFSGEKAYFKLPVDALSEAASLAIDANVYVTLKNGKVMRFFSGTEDPWTLRGIDPPLQSNAGIWTSLDADRVIMADPTGKRVIVVSKDGQLVAQILSQKFQGPTDVTADAKNKKLYVVDGNKVLQVEMP
jgi:hypothetical protein